VSKKYLYLARTEDLTAMKISILVFRAEDEGSRHMFLRNVDMYLKVHTALQLRRPTSIITLFTKSLDINKYKASDMINGKPTSKCADGCRKHLRNSASNHRHNENKIKTVLPCVEASFIPLLIS
jgi:hypothetical protein